jgi:hypothetical protein
MFFGSDVLPYMKSIAGHDGWLPVGPLPVLLLWLPTLIVGLGLAARRLIAAVTRAEQEEKVEQVLLAGLLGSGLFQTYLAYKLLDNCAPYTVKTLFFFTFPLATLFWLVWGVRLAQRRDWFAAGWWTAPAGRRVAIFVASFVLVILGWRFAKMDRGLGWGIPNFASMPDGRVYPPRAYLPHGAATALRELGDNYRGHYYFDPNQPVGSYYASLVGLRMDLDFVQLSLEKSQRRRLEDLLTIDRVRGILMPRYYPDPASLATVPVEVTDIGRFWLCRLMRTDPPIMARNRNDESGFKPDVKR